LTGVRRRRIHVANLDPAAEQFKYELAFDVRDLINVEEVMEELGLGPNGGLIYCMEYLVNNLDWLQDHLDEFGDDEYLILDCPGQLELYSHIPLMRTIFDRMKMWGYGGNMISVFLLDTTFLCDTSKFISGSLLSLSAMISLELPHVNIMTKCDLMSEPDIERILNIGSASEVWSIEQDTHSLMHQDQDPYGDGGLGGDGYGTNHQHARQGVNRNNDMTPSNVTPTATATTTAEEAEEEEQERTRRLELEQRRRRRQRLTESICQLLDDYTMVSFLPLNIRDEESLDHVLSIVDSTIQYGEDLEVRGADYNLDAADDDGGFDDISDAFGQMS
jgi:GPN-loop GTPase